MVETLELKDCIWHSVCDAFETTVLTPIERVDDDDAGGYDGILLAGTITFMGKLEGCLAIQCGMACAKKIAKSMLMMDEEEELEDGEVNDALGEVTNLVIGGLKTRLIETIGDLKISIPTVTKGRKLRPALGLGSERFSVFAQIEKYLIEFVFAYKRKNPSG